MNLFDIAPIKLYVAYYRPEYTYIEGTNYWDMRFLAKYTLRGPYVEYDVTENMKTFKSSFVDWWKNIDSTDDLPWPYEQSDFEYNDNYESDYTNPDYTFEFIDLFHESSKLFFYGDDVTIADVYLLHPEENTFFKIPQKPERHHDEVGPIGPEPEPDPAQEM